MEPLVSLAAAAIALVGTHFALSHTLRAPLVATIGERGFMALYSVVALGCMAWMVFAFRAAPAADLGGSGTVGWIVATVLTLPALVLFAGSLRGNPALPAPDAAQAAQRTPTGVFAVTRHPMMWGFALWALSHLVLWWDRRTVIVAVAILVLALGGARLQDAKKARQLGTAWRAWEARTRYWPRWGRLAGAGWRLWLLAVAVWLAITWAHIHAAGIPAGIWRWL